MKKHITILFISLLSVSVQAQEMWGTANSNYSGTMGTFLNPSTIVDAPYKYEIHFWGGNFFAGNNFVYIPSDKKVISRSFAGDFGNEKLVYDAGKDKKYDAYVKSMIIGPSFVSNAGNSAWGFHTALRNEWSASNVPYHFSKMMFEKFDYNTLWNQNFSSDPFSTAMLSWGEIGGTYGRVFMNTEKDYIKWAATVNLLSGFNGAYLDVRSFDYSVIDSANVTINSLDATLAHAVPTENLSVGNMMMPRGFGVGTNLGVTYIHNRSQAAYDCNKTSDYFSKYQYRVGLSLIDFGYIRFNKQAQVLDLNTSNNVLWDGIDTANISSFSDLDSMMSAKINGLYAVSNESFSMFLPAAISLQFDYKLCRRLYANATFINRVHFSAREIARSNQMSFSLRYERRMFEPALSMTFYEYAQPSVGFALRHSFFVIGTDRLLEWMSLTDMKTLDFYFGFKVNLCELNLFGKKSTCIAYGNQD